MQGSIADLLQQITSFETHFEKVTSENHPFFGGLDYDYWKKFHVKHFTHHFKQFNLI
jgi:hydroxymethylglutaryl-CoA reductase